MRTPAMLIFASLLATPVAAQDGGGRYGRHDQGIPPGHLPPPGECRVWYDGRPPGHQPPPTSCREAERIAARDRYARVIYGGHRDRRDDRRDEGWWDRDDDRRDRGRDRGRAVPRRGPTGSPYPGRRYPYPDDRRYPDHYPETRGSYGYERIPFDNGYRDGYDKGREDARDNDAYNPRRHSRYRSADRGYDRRYGSKDEYREIYRDGFHAGYDDGYRELDRYRSERRRGSSRFPWPF